MLYVRHITASGRLDEAWSYDPVARVVTALVRVGAVSLEVHVPVCSRDAPRIGTHPIRRVDSETWLILAARYIDRNAVRGCALAPELAYGTSIQLTNTPPDVTLDLEALAEEEDVTVAAARESLAPVPAPVTHVPCPVCPDCPCCAGAGMVTAARAAQFAPTDPPPPEAA